MRAKTMTSFQMYLILVLSIGLSNHVILNPVLLDIAKRDSWIGAAASLVPMLVWSCLLYVIARRTSGPGLGAWIKERYGTAASALLKTLIVSYLLVNCYISLYDTVTWTQVTYLPRTPKYVIAASLLLLCALAARAGIRAIAVSAGLLLPVVVALGYFVTFANVKYKDYSLLTPMLTHGAWPVVKSAAYTCGSMSELIFILLLKGYVSTEIRIKPLLVWTIVLTGLTVGPLIGSITIFGPFEAADQRYPPFEQWRMVMLGKFISHLDFFSIYQWISGAFVRFSLLFFLLADQIAPGLNRKGNARTLIGLYAFFLLLILVPLSDHTYLSIVSGLYFPGILGLNLLVTLLLLVLIWLPAGRKGGAAPS